MVRMIEVTLFGIENVFDKVYNATANAVDYMLTWQAPDFMLTMFLMNWIMIFIMFLVLRKVTPAEAKPAKKVKVVYRGNEFIVEKFPTTYNLKVQKLGTYKITIAEVDQEVNEEKGTYKEVKKNVISK